MKETHRNFNPSCSSCGLQKLCFPTGLTHSDILSLDQVVVHDKPRLRKGEVLYHAHTPFKSLFAIRSGMVKIYTSLEDGTEVIHGFYFSGDVVGFDGIDSGRYQQTVEAVDETHLCELPYAELKTLAHQLPTLNLHLYEVLSRKLNDSIYQAQFLVIKSAEQRLANFLFHTIERIRLRGYDELDFYFPILHREVANYLGLTPETVSRLLSQLSKNKVVTWRKRRVTVHDKEALKQLAGIAGIQEDLSTACTDCPKRHHY